MNIVDLVVGEMVQYGIIEEEDLDIYKYGLKAFGMLTINVVTVFILGNLWNDICFTIVLLVSFSWLRAYVGGYHAKSRLKCYFLSSILFMLCLIIKNNYISQPNLFLTFIMAVATIAILLMKRNVRHEEYYNYKQTKTAVIILWCGYIGATIMQYHFISLAIIASFCLLAVLKAISK